jgi:predicted aconitase
VYDEAKEAGHISVLEDFGVQFVNDTCWCMLTEPVVPVGSEALITNSAKYAHYAPGLVSDPCQMAT